ncbi:MAG: hypothetical protein ACI91T_002520 [Natronomonas sp.]|jgi:hypothetical protein
MDTWERMVQGGEMNRLEAVADPGSDCCQRTQNCGYQAMELSDESDAWKYGLRSTAARKR